MYRATVLAPRGVRTLAGGIRHMAMSEVEQLLAAVRQHIENRIRDGYGPGSMTVTVHVYPLNAEPQERAFHLGDCDA